MHRAPDGVEWISQLVREHGQEIVLRLVLVPHPLFLVLPRGDVAEERAEPVGASRLDRRHGQLDRELGPVPAQSLDLDAAIQDRRLARVAVSLEPVPMCRAISFRDHELL